MTPFQIVSRWTSPLPIIYHVMVPCELCQYLWCCPFLSEQTSVALGQSKMNTSCPTCSRGHLGNTHLQCCSAQQRHSFGVIHRQVHSYQTLSPSPFRTKPCHNMDSNSSTSLWSIGCPYSNRHHSDTSWLATNNILDNHCNLLFWRHVVWLPGFWTYGALHRKNSTSSWLFRK